MKFLIIWQEIPEDTKLYEIELDGEDAETAVKAHGQLVNTPNDEAALWLSRYLDTSKVQPIPGVLRNRRYDAIIVTGFLL